jgi:cell division protein FtsW
VNIGGVVGSLPLTGLTLPFLSYGGSSLMTSLVAAGLLLNVARNMK